MHTTSLLPSLGYTIYYVHYRGYKPLNQENALYPWMPPGSPEGTQETDFPPDASLAYQQLALSENEAWENCQLPLLGISQIFKFQPTHPLTMPPLSTKQLDQSVPIIPTKGWNVTSLAFLGWVEGPKASTETRPPDL
jgi:hypothetical protein